MRIDNLHIWILHYTPLTERKSSMIEQLEKTNLNYTFIENYDREVLKESDIEKFSILRPNQCSLILKNIEAMKRIQKSKSNYNLILEDDVILCEDFCIRLEKALTELPPHFDMLFIGDGYGVHIPSKYIKPNKNIYEKSREPTEWGGNGGTRCTDSVLISKICCKRIVMVFEQSKQKSINLAIDWWINEVIRKLKLEIFWMEPTITKQGSQIGKYLSTQK